MRVLIFEKSDLRYLGEDSIKSLTDFDVIVKYTDALDPEIEEKIESDDKVDKFVTHFSSLIIASDLIVIQYNNDDVTLRLANHLRLTDLSNKKPILIVGEDLEIEVHRTKPDLARILLTKGTKYYDGDIWNNEFVNSAIATLNKELIDLYVDENAYYDGLLKRLLELQQ